MADGFSVDLNALRKAAEGILDTLNAMATKQVSDIDADKSAFGHGGLADTVADFCDRWNIGVTHLAKDGQEIIDRLIVCVNAYSHVDRVSAERLDGIVSQATGTDPGAEP
ncbi:MAG TPA: hypothetical protein VFC19_34495 [Candidatus Limnocylindrales bacterium]|nr:hypothetical protein [Candidatus Limnocylindrales bacterium]